MKIFIIELSMHEFGKNLMTNSLEKVKSNVNTISSIFDQDSVYENYVKIPQPADSSFADHTKPIKPKNFSRSFSAFFKKNSFYSSSEKKPKISHKTTPNNLWMDKETLYIENLALKKQLNEVNEEIPALKTKINRLEEELSQSALLTQNCGTRGVNLKKKYLNLSSNLKEMVQQANKTLKIKDNQLEKLKTSFKSTKITELLEEIKEYKEECERLRACIHKKTKEYDELDTNFYSQTRNLHALQKENQELKRTCEKLEEKQKKFEDASTDLKKPKKNPKIKELEKIVNDLRVKLFESILQNQEEKLLLKQELLYLRQKCEEYKKSYENSQNEQRDCIKIYKKKLSARFTISLEQNYQILSEKPWSKLGLKQKESKTQIFDFNADRVNDFDVTDGLKNVMKKFPILPGKSLYWKNNTKLNKTSEKNVF